MMEYKARGSATVEASSFPQARCGTRKPVRDGSWYSEPWSIYLLGQQDPGPSKHGYDVSLTFTGREGRQLTWRRWASPTR